MKTLPSTVYGLLPLLFSLLCVCFTKGRGTVSSFAKKKFHAGLRVSAAACNCKMSGPVGMSLSLLSTFPLVLNITLNIFMAFKKRKNYKLLTLFKGSVERSRHERHFCSPLPYFLLSWLQIFQLCLSFWTSSYDMVFFLIPSGKRKIFEKPPKTP